MAKEIHFHFFRGESVKNLAVFYDTAMEELAHKKECIHTVQFILLKEPLLSMGYKIFIHPYTGRTFEIKLGNNKPYTDRYIREEHNLLNLILAGEFDTSDTWVSLAHHFKGKE